MATGPCHLPCTLAGTPQNSFYFQVGEDETDLQSDSFRISTTSPLHWLINKDNLFLYLDGGDQLVFARHEQSRPECQFTFRYFKEDPQHHPLPVHRGMAVTLYTVVNGKFKVVKTCEKKDEIKVETMDILPETILDDNYAALFFMKNHSNKYLFESVVHKDHVLGFGEVGDFYSMRKLLLRPRYAEEVDERCLIDTVRCQQT